MKRLSFLICCLVTTICFSYSQSNIRDSAINLSVLSANYSFHITGGDMANRFGNANMIGLRYYYKLKSNYFFGLSYDFLFSSKVHETNVFDNIKTSSGYIITGQGLLEEMTYEERGYTLLLKTGKIFPAFNINPNSGIYCAIGAGFMQHKINFKYLNGPIYQLEGDYKKGYDRLTNGLTLYESVGFQFFSNTNLGNFHIGFDFWQGFTQNRRDWNFSTMEKDIKKRLDLLYGINIGLDIPFYKRAPEEYYMN